MSSLLQSREPSANARVVKNSGAGDQASFRKILRSGLHCLWRVQLMLTCTIARHMPAHKLEVVSVMRTPIRRSLHKKRATSDARHVWGSRVAIAKRLPPDTSIQMPPSTAPHYCNNRLPGWFLRQNTHLLTVQHVESTSGPHGLAMLSGTQGQRTAGHPADEQM